MKNNEETKNNWNDWSNEYYSKEYKGGDTLAILKNTPWKAFPSRVWESLNLYYPSLGGVKICVPSSGDNIAVFAFHLLGAEVTSCDISSEQIKNAQKIADANKWNIDFRVSDSMEMSDVESKHYDLVYTSNGVHTWISDLPMLHGNFNRILKKGGHYIFFATHPFIRPFDDKTNELRVRKLYSDTSNNDWRVQDFANSLIESGFTLNHMDELYAEKNIKGAHWWDLSEWDEKANWKINPYAALPQWISFITTK